MLGTDPSWSIFIVGTILITDASATSALSSQVIETQTQRRQILDSNGLGIRLRSCMVCLGIQERLDAICQ